MPSLELLLLWLAGFSTLVYICKIALMFFGGDLGGDLVETEYTDSDASFKIFTIQSVTSFSMGFGWLGYFFISSGHTSASYLGIAIVFGLVMMFFSAFIMRLTTSFDTGEYSFVPKPGMQATTYTVIAPNKKTVGLVHIVDPVTHRTQQFQALNEDLTEIPSHTAVQIKDIHNKTLIVTKI